MNRKFKKSFFCNTVKVFTVAFDRFNLSLVNKSNLFSLFILLKPQTFECKMHIS